MMTRQHDSRHRARPGHPGTFSRWSSFLLVVALLVGFSGLHRLARVPQHGSGPATGIGLRLGDVTGGEAWDLFCPLEQTSRGTWSPPVLVYVRSLPAETVHVPAVIFPASLTGPFRAPPPVWPFL